MRAQKWRGAGILLSRFTFCALHSSVFLLHVIVMKTFICHILCFSVPILFPLHFLPHGPDPPYSRAAVADASKVNIDLRCPLLLLSQLCAGWWPWPMPIWIRYVQNTVSNFGIRYVQFLLLFPLLLLLPPPPLSTPAVQINTLS
jgi:hypothetical protein